MYLTEKNGVPTPVLILQNIQQQLLFLVFIRVQDIIDQCKKNIVVVAAINILVLI